MPIRSAWRGLGGYHLDVGCGLTSVAAEHADSSWTDVTYDVLYADCDPRTLRHHRAENGAQSVRMEL